MQTLYSPPVPLDNTRKGLVTQAVWGLSGGLHFIVNEDRRLKQVKPTAEKETQTHPVSADALHSSAIQGSSPPSASISNSSTNQTLFFDQNAPPEPHQWSPVLSLKQLRSAGEEGAERVRLSTQAIFPQRNFPKFVLKEEYELLGSFPRSFFVVLLQNGIKESFVFSYPDHPWFNDLSGLRKSAYTTFQEHGSNEVWELHLKPSRDKTNIFGYLCKESDMLLIIRQQQDNLLVSRRLPLVCDLDDTLVRLVGNEPRYTSVADAALVPHRVRTLRDGRRVVLTERVEEFLAWAAQFYEISVCSLGDQNYVNMVVDVLDPQRTNVRGILYSARAEYEYITKSAFPRRPPKDLLSIFSFCAARDKSLVGAGYSLPLIVDDLTSMWPKEQQDCVIAVKDKRGAPVWTVPLFPMVQHVLQHVHEVFFKQLDAWGTGRSSSGPPSAVAIYKEFLRSHLSASQSV